ncbi:MAG: hypothetical protein AAF213_00490 [Pseudomonadota bacterium]
MLAPTPQDADGQASPVVDTKNLAVFRTRRTAADLQRKFHERIRRHITNGLKAANIAGLGPDHVTEPLLEYGVARSKKRLSVDDQDFTTMIRKAQKAAHRCACGKEVTPQDIRNQLEMVSEIAASTLEESEDRAVNDMAGRFVDRSGIFEQELFQGPNRLYFDLPQGESLIAPQIDEALGALGYTEMDYVEGTIKNAYGDRTKIGKALQKHKLTDLYDQFQKDEARADPAVVMISREAEDVARMSTNRDWKTCIVAGSHRFNRHMPEDLEHGMLVAYLVRPNDPEAHEPMAVMNLKPYSNDEQGTILVPNRPYGTSDSRFPSFVKEVIDATVNRDKTGTFTMPRTMLSDDLDYEVERKADGTITSAITMLPPEPKQTGRVVPEGTKLGDKITI